jgi:hypothetical protein
VEVLASHFPSSPRDKPPVPSLPLLFHEDQRVANLDRPLALLFSSGRHQFLTPGETTNRMHDFGISRRPEKWCHRQPARLPKAYTIHCSFGCLLAVAFHHVSRLERSESKSSSKISTSDRAQMGHANTFDAVARRRACRLMLESHVGMGRLFAHRKTSKRFQLPQLLQLLTRTNSQLSSNHPWSALAIFSFPGEPAS